MLVPETWEPIPPKKGHKTMNILTSEDLQDILKLDYSKC